MACRFDSAALAGLVALSLCTIPLPLCSIDNEADWKSAVLGVTLVGSPASGAALINEDIATGGGTTTRLSGPLAALTVAVLAAKLSYSCAALASSVAQGIVSSPLDMLFLAAHCVRATFDSGTSLSAPQVGCRSGVAVETAQMCEAGSAHDTQRPMDFSRYRCSSWLAASDELGDGRTVAPSTSSVVFTLTSVARALLPYGAAFVDRVLPALAALEYIAEHRVASDTLLAEARVLRFRAQVAARDIAGALLHLRLAFLSPRAHLLSSSSLVAQGPLRRSGFCCNFRPEQLCLLCIRNPQWRLMPLRAPQHCSQHRHLPLLKSRSAPLSPALRLQRAGLIRRLLEQPRAARVAALLLLQPRRPPLPLQRQQRQPLPVMVRKWLCSLRLRLTTTSPSRLLQTSSWHHG